MTPSDWILEGLTFSSLHATAVLVLLVLLVLICLVYWGLVLRSAIQHRVRHLEWPSLMLALGLFIPGMLCLFELTGPYAVAATDISEAIAETVEPVAMLWVGVFLASYILNYVLYQLSVFFSIRNERRTG